jgi:hypothetical protein
MGVCMKAWPMVWRDTAKFKHRFLIPGTFHMGSVNFRITGKMMAGSGLEDIVQESGILKGSIYSVMNGKNYAGCLRVHTAECLERRMSMKFLEQIPLPEEPKVVVDRWPQLWLMMIYETTWTST